MQFLTEHIREWHKKSDRSPQDDAGAIHPSSLGDCNRLAIYKYRGLERDLEHNDFQKRIFFHGYRIEDWMSAALKEKGLLIAGNVSVRAEYKGVPIEGTLDHIVRWQDGWCIADTKSVSDHAFKYQSFPYSHHVLQVGLYQWGLSQMRERVHKDMTPQESRQWTTLTYQLLAVPEYPPVLFYVGRGNLEEVTVTAGDGAMDLALEELDEMVLYISNQAYPPRPFHTPDEHPYLCASRIRKGYKKKDGTYSPGKEPLYKPNCSYFLRCWGCLPVEWSFWSQVINER